MRPEKFDVDELISDLTGTCKTISECLPEGMEEDDLTTSDLGRIDEEIFNCPTCNWWNEVGSGHENDDGEDVCEDCYPE